MPSIPFQVFNIPVFNSVNFLFWFSSLEEELDSFDKVFEYMEHEIDVRVESLKVELDLNGNKLIRKLNKFIRIKSLKQEETSNAENSLIQKFMKIIIKKNDNKIILKDIGFISKEFYYLEENGVPIEKLKSKKIKYFILCT